MISFLKSKGRMSHKAESSLKARLRHFFVRDDEGATAVEFGIIAAPFIGCIGMGLMMTYIFATSVSLEEGVREAGRLIRVGQIEKNSITKTEFRNLICDRVIMAQNDCRAKLVIDVDSAPTVGTLPDNSPRNGSGALDRSRESYNPGAGTNYVIVKAYLPISSLNSLFEFLGDDADRSFTLATATAFRNEPF